MGIFDFSKHDDLNPKTYSNYNEQIESAVQVFEQNVDAGAGPQALLLPETLPSGVYLLVTPAGEGKFETFRFVLQR